MAKIKFITNYKTKEQNPKSYTAGDIVELPEPSCKHFTNRGVAIFIKETKQEKATPVPAIVEEKKEKLSLEDKLNLLKKSIKLEPEKAEEKKEPLKKGKSKSKEEEIYGSVSEEGLL